MRREGFRQRPWDKSKFSVGLSTSLVDAPAIEEIEPEPEPVHKPPHKPKPSHAKGRE